MKFSKTQSYSLLAAMLAVASAHRARVEPFGPELAHTEFVTPASVGASFGHSFFAGAAHDPTKVATDFVERELSSSDYVVKNSYTSAHNGVTHVYLRQMVDGLEVVNGNMNINVDRNGNVISYGDSFYKGQRKVDILSIKDWIKKETETFREGRQLSFGNWGRRTRQVTIHVVFEQHSIPHFKRTFSAVHAYKLSQNTTAQASGTHTTDRCTWKALYWIYVYAKHTTTGQQEQEHRNRKLGLLFHSLLALFLLSSPFFPLFLFSCVFFVCA